MINRIKILCLILILSYSLLGCNENNNIQYDNEGNIIHQTNKNGKYTGVDGYKEYPACEEWDKYDKGRGYQLLDVYFYEGEKIEDVINSFQNSEYVWNIVYNPEADVNVEKSLDIGMNGNKWITLHMNNYTELDYCFQKDATLTRIEISSSDTVKQCLRIMKDYTYYRMDKLSEEELEKLNETMFANCDVAFFRKYQTDTQATYKYIIRYPLNIHSNNPNDTGIIGKDLGCEMTYKFTYNFADKSIEFEENKNLGIYENYLNKEYYNETFTVSDESK